MMNRKHDAVPIGLGICLVALATALAPHAFAQSAPSYPGSAGEPPAAVKGANAPTPEGLPRNMPDMRLWSFGECDNRFPYTKSEEHKECVRVVGSEEAKEARAFKVCENSNSMDPAEVNRCKSTYLANKQRSAQHGYVPNAPAQPQVAPTAEELARVRAIATSAVERDKAAATAPDPETGTVRMGDGVSIATGKVVDPTAQFAPPEPPESNAMSIILTLVALGAAVGGGINFYKKRQAGGRAYTL